MKRTVITTLAATALGAAAGPALAQHDLTVVSWGGAYQDGQREVYFKPFNAGGTKLIDASWDGGVGVLRTKIKGGNNNWDKSRRMNYRGLNLMFKNGKPI